MKYLLSTSFILFILSQQVFASGLKDNLLAIQYEKLEGSLNNSLNGSAAYGLTYQTYTRLKPLRFFLGGNFMYSSGRAYILDVPYNNATYYSGDLLAGISFSPFIESAISPFLELTGAAGFKSVTLSSPPSGEENIQTRFSYGYKVSIGFDINYSNRKDLRISADYNIRTADDMFGRTFDFNALGGSIGIVF